MLSATSELFWFITNSYFKSSGYPGLQLMEEKKVTFSVELICEERVSCLE